jgi:hypothetical protein
MLGRGGLSQPTVLEIISSTERIGSDSKKAEVLARVARDAQMDAETEARLRKAAKSIGSDSAYRRVMKELRGGSERADNGD